MISEERLKELIEQEKDIWVHGENDVSIGCIHLDKKYQPELYVNGLNNYILYVYANDKLEYKEEIFDDELYETKEEAEFVAKYHCSKTIKFEPPTFEEFIKTASEDVFANWSCDDFHIVMVSENNEKGIMHTCNVVEVSVFGHCGELDKHFFYEYNEFEDTRKQAYYQAVEYAKKLFLGEAE